MRITGVTCQKDDGPYLVEWLAHHLAAGIDRMLVYSHDCTDGSDRLLDALTADPRILHVPFTPEGERSVQWQALALSGRHDAYRSADWALVFDCDEFLCLEDGTLGSLIASLGLEADAIALPWRFFGSGGQRRHEAGLTPRRFRRAAPPDLHFPLAHLYKTLHRPGAFQKPGVHRPRNRKGEVAVWYAPDGTSMSDAFAQGDQAISLYGAVTGRPMAWLNHYSLRSVQEFMVKRARGLPNHMDRDIGMTYWVERNWNDVEDRTIDRMLPDTDAEVDRLMALPGVAEAHAACLADHRDRYARIEADIEALRFEYRVTLAGDSKAPSAAEGRRFATRIGRRVSRAKGAA